MYREGRRTFAVLWSCVESLLSNMRETCPVTRIRRSEAIGLWETLEFVKLVFQYDVMELIVAQRKELVCALIHLPAINRGRARRAESAVTLFEDGGCFKYSSTRTARLKKIGIFSGVSGSHKAIR